MSNVQVYMGAEGIKAVYRQSLLQDSIDIVCLSQRYKQVIGDFFETQYAPKLYGKVKTRELLPDTTANRKDAKLKNLAYNRVRFVSDLRPIESDLLIWSNTVVLVSYGDHPMAMVITDQEICRQQVSHFDAIWKAAQALKILQPV